jgi:hypothetical protein
VPAPPACASASQPGRRHGGGRDRRPHHADAEGASGQRCLIRGNQRPSWRNMVRDVATRDEIAACRERRGAAERYYLRDLPTVDVPQVPGIYALWFKGELVYVGIVTRDPGDTTNPNARGLAGRLSAHRTGRMSNHSALSTAFRFVFPALSEKDRALLATGELGVRAVQAMTRKWIADNVEFSAIDVSAVVARAAEPLVQESGLAGSRPPAFNPLP